MGAAALVSQAPEDPLLSADHTMARTLAREAKLLEGQLFVGTLNKCWPVSYRIGAVLPQPPPFVTEKRAEVLCGEKAVLCFLRASCTVSELGLQDEEMYAAVDRDGGLRIFLISPTKPELGCVLLYLDETAMTLTGGDETWRPGQEAVVQAVLESRCPAVAEPVRAAAAAEDPPVATAATDDGDASSAATIARPVAAEEPPARPAPRAAAPGGALREGDAFDGVERHPMSSRGVPRRFPSRVALTPRFLGWARSRSASPS
jgi:hypothetical protein